jgi:hypothetical protein
LDDLAVMPARLEPSLARLGRAALLVLGTPELRQLVDVGDERAAGQLEAMAALLEQR